MLVAGRSFSDLPDQVPADHPIRHCPSLDVAQTGAVRDLEVRALAELREQANTPVAREILRLVTASGGGLSAADLSELAGVDRFDVDAAVTGGLGRSLQCVDGSSDDCGYIYAHASLLETAATLLQRDIPKYRAKINDWGATWARAGWPDETPGYLTGLYSRLLLEQADVVTLTELAIDPARHGLLYRRTHADAAALRECRDAHQLWCRSDRPDLVAVGQLTAQRCLLDVRSSKLLSLIPVLWATLGEPDRAEQLANSFTDLEKRATVLADIADALAPVDPDRADDIVESAEQNARSVDDPADRTSALVGVAERIAATNPDRAAAIARSAEQIARSIADPWRRDLGLARVAEFVAAANQDEAETIALSIEDSESRCRALITVAREIGARHPDHAQDLAQMAEQILRSIERPSAWIAAAVAQKMTAIDPDRAEAIARSIDDPSSRWNALAVIAVDVAASDPERAEVLGRSIDEPDRRARALAAVAVQIAATDPDRAEEIARSIEDPGGRAWSLAQVAVEMAPTDSRRARRLAESAEEIALASAEQIARVNQDSWELLAVVASDLAATAGPDRAEAVARALDDPVGRARVLGRVASQIADTDPDRAEAIARSIDDPEERADALAFVAARIVATDRERARSMLESGEQLLRSIESPDDWARTLAGVAEHIASTDPDRAESVARSIRDADYRSIALVDVAEQLASTDPDRAETLARSISDPRGRSRALASVAERVAPNDPDRARTIVDAAQQSAASIEDADDRSWAVTRAADVARFAEVLGADSDRVESLAESIEDLARRSEALAGHAKHIATTDPLSALDVAGSIPLLEVRLEALVDVVERIAAGDPRRAEALTQSIGSPEIRVLLMVAVIEHIAEDDTDGAKAIGETAERIARSIEDPAVGALLVANVAASIAVADPDRMAAIADSIEDPFLLAEVAKRVVGSDPDRAHDMAESAARSAELMAQSLDAPMRRALVLAALAEQLATVDSDRARALAESAWDVARSIAERPTWMLDDMVQVAGSLAIADPDRARTVASLIEVPEVRAEALANIAERIAAGDPRRATNMVCAGLLSDEWTTFLPAMGLVDPTAVAGLVDSLLVPA
ncbi:MAG TPA: hypothetical protein VNN79_11865 [Actinomycetota bacterium]|nr:hypothetical protein [Actinomycetota bacterium]